MTNIIVNFFSRCIFIGLFCLGTIGGNPAYAYDEDQHVLFTDVLSIYVRERNVDYKNLKDDFRFESYLQQLQNTDPQKIENDNDRMAFWINVYNAFTIKLILDHYPLKSINQLHKGGLIIGTLFKSTIWQTEVFEVNGEEITLNDIEHEILRKEFQDARIHFAIVCASIGCPPLREEAYEGYKLDQQLTDQAKRFLSEREKNFFDFKQNVAFLSPIFKWFKKDFGKNNQEVLTYLSQFLDPQRAREIRDYIDMWKIKYTKYDWNLNDW